MSTHHHNELQTHHDFQHPHHHPIPIPDLRFEYSYLRSLGRYIQTSSQTSTYSVTAEDRYASSEKERYEYERLRVRGAVSNKVVRVQWTGVAWVTLRDQVISPLLQGALWALVSYWITPLSGSLGSRLGNLTRNMFHLPSKEGKGSAWLRSWLGGLGFATVDSSAGNAPSR